MNKPTITPDVVQPWIATALIGWLAFSAPNNTTAKPGRSVTQTLNRDNYTTTGLIKMLPSIQDIDYLSRRYAFQNLILVSKFLQLYPDVAVNLAIAIGHIDYIWGANTAINVEICESPDGHSFDTLLAYIQTTDGVDQSLVKLSLFSDAWWGSAIRDINGKLQFDVEWV